MTQQNAPSSARPSRWAHGAVLIGYALLTVVMTWPAARSAAAAIPGDSFDGWQNYWNVWWLKVALIERVQWPYVTDLLYAPTGVGLYFHTLNPFNGLVSMPLQLAGNLFVAYNGVVLLSWTLAGYGAFLLALWVFGQKPQENATAHRSHYLAAGLAGIVYGFSPFHSAHLLGHMQVFSLQWIPFYILYLLRGVQRARAGQPWQRDGWMAGLFLALAGLCDWYFVLYLFLFTAFVVAWSVIASVWRRNAPRAIAGAIGVPVLAGVLFLLLVGAALVPMVREATQFSFMVRPSSDLYILSASLLDFVIPNRLHTLWRPESFTWPGNQIAPVSERTIAIGYLPLLLGIIGMWRRPRQAALWLALALFFILLALGPQPALGNITWEDVPADAEQVSDLPNWSLYVLLNQAVPFMRISRSVSRFALVVQLCVAVAAALGLGALIARMRSRVVVRAISVSAFAIVIGEYWVAPYPVSPPDTPEYYSLLGAEQGDGAVLNLPMNYDRPGYLLYQTVHKRPLTVAYISRDDPRTLTERVPVLQHFRHLGPDVLDVDPAVVGQTVLADLGVGYVILDRYKMPGGEEREYTTALAQRVFVGQSPVFEDERITVYRVNPSESREAYLGLGPVNWGPLVEHEVNGQSVTGRRIGAEPVELRLYGAPMDSRLHVRYFTAGPQGASIHDSSGQTLIDLGSAPDGETVEVEISDGVAMSPLRDDLGEYVSLFFVSHDPQGVIVESIQLEVGP